jgi:SAM-dependent methyltransferase
MRFRWQRAAAFVAATLALALVGLAQSKVPAIVGEYWGWRETAKPLPKGEDPIALFEAKLRAGGLSPAAAAAEIETLRRGLIVEEGEFYDAIYAKGPNFNSQPNKLLVEAVKGRTPGRALDVGMGQGRNAVYLARQGWDVTGFDPSAVGLEQAHSNAAKAEVKISTVQAGAEYFDFGLENWDLIAIIYPIEKASVYRVREALKPGGLVVVEAPHKETAPYPHHYDSNELLEIFAGFRILKYEDTRAVADWDLKEVRLVRLVTEKPR